jgi:hypothetical protein
MPDPATRALVQTMDAILLGAPAADRAPTAAAEGLRRLARAFPHLSGADLPWAEAELERRLALRVEPPQAWLAPGVALGAWSRAPRPFGGRLGRRHQTWAMVQGVPGAERAEAELAAELALSALIDPQEPGPWRRRVLAVEAEPRVPLAEALANRAADAGYALQIWLSGPAEAERVALQRRVDEAVVGAASGPSGDPARGRLLGVGEVDRDPTVSPVSCTHRGHGGGDLPRGLTGWSRARVLVVARRADVLDGLAAWARGLSGRSGAPPALPTLLIDLDPTPAGGAAPLDGLRAAFDRLGELRVCGPPMGVGHEGEAGGDAPVDALIWRSSAGDPALGAARPPALAAVDVGAWAAARAGQGVPA